MINKIVLIVLDGWGIAAESEGNAIGLAKTPTYDKLVTEYSSTVLAASGSQVGLPSGVAGNSQAGHKTIGSGRVIKSELLEINQAIHKGTFYRNSVLKQAFNHAKTHERSVHLMGLLSDGAVHSHINHVYALLEMAKREKVGPVYVHAFLDGIDVPKRTAAKYVQHLESRMARLKIGQIATLIGRYYAMDRDNNWDREYYAYTGIIDETGETYSSAQEALKDRYSKGEEDHLVKPCHIHPHGEPTRHIVEDKDTLIFFNFRSDRERQLACTFTCPQFEYFPRKRFVDLYFVGLAEYDRHMNSPVAFPPPKTANVLSEYLGKQGFRQMRVAETEKYAHLTYFFNAETEQPFPLEDRKLIESDKVMHPERKPRMKAKEIGKAVEEAIPSDYDFIAANFANADILGHTGDIKAAKKGVTAVDKALRHIIRKAQKNFAEVVITADHGNAEEMLMNGQAYPAHTDKKVPFIVVSLQDYKLREGGSLADVAPTILDLMGLKKPPEMTGKSLIIH